MAHRLTIKPSAKPAMTVDRRAVRDDKLVYVICTPKAKQYLRGRSRIICIGATEKGGRSDAATVASKAIGLLPKHGFKRLEVYTVTCPPRPDVQSRAKLERDLLLTFQQEYGRSPLANKPGKKVAADMFSGLFKNRRLRKVLAAYA